MSSFWKNKKILAYIALAHHTRFITPVMDLLQSKGATVKYIVGQAERSQEITAIVSGLPYSHIFDYISGNDSEEVLSNYHRFRKRFAQSLTTDFILGTMALTVTDKALFATASEYVGFKKMIKTEKPDLCFALHELNRWGKMFAFWAKKNNIPFVTLQEGLIYNLDFIYTGFAQYSALNLVWGKRIKNKLVGYEAPEAKLIPVGNTHLANEIEYQSKHNIRGIKRKDYDINDRLALLIVLPAKLTQPGLLAPLFKTISENNHLFALVKFHPSCNRLSIRKWCGAIKDQYKKNIHFIHDQERIYDILSMADIVVLAHKSTAGMESVAYGKPLIKLDFAYVPGEAYSFVDKKVATKMSIGELSDALVKKVDFSGLVDRDATQKYIENELTGTTDAAKTVCRTMKKAIQACNATNASIACRSKRRDLAWSIILHASSRKEILLPQLEAIACNSESGGSYETFIVIRENPPLEIREILDSLQGNLKITFHTEKEPFSLAVNALAETARGRHFIILEKNMAPLKGWLAALEKGTQTHKEFKLFTGRVSGPDGKIANAGMVIAGNHIPVSAYQHLNLDFKVGRIERAFQLADHYLAIERNLFAELGGLSRSSGAYGLMDLCLEAGRRLQTREPVMYLPDSGQIFLDRIPPKSNTDEAIYFFSRWNGTLWESESRLLRSDGITRKDLDLARLTSAMQAVR